MKIGVLASQGAFAEHIQILKRLGVEAIPVRLPKELLGLDGLIIPGGESTTISRMMAGDKLNHEIKKLGEEGFPLWGTCAGLILLAKGPSGSHPEPLGLLDVSVKRNAFGRQRESFEAALAVPALGEEPFPAVFIRAPAVGGVNGKVEILARLDEATIVAVRQGKLMGTSFHPELTDDLRFHQYFLDVVYGKK
ncbi:pyridoxal 5'-phosphate synthase glutaminase subunit PdxT [Chloroflexota bacterium]